MDFQNFNFPFIDNLKEGVDYWVMDWNFSDQSQSLPDTKRTPGTPCPPGEKVVFGICRKVKQGGEWDSDNDTKQESELKKAAQKESSTFENNKAVGYKGKKFGWAIKGGKPVIVAWGSVAGGAKVPSAKQPSQPQSPAVQTNRMDGLKKALASQTTESGRQAIQNQIRQLGG
jgi:hypothetical protein